MNCHRFCSGSAALILSMALVQIVYTRAGNLAQQFLMLCIDGATSSEDFMVVESEGSCATLPECIELLRMMHEQVSKSDRCPGSATCGVLSGYNFGRAIVGMRSAMQLPGHLAEDGLLHR